MLVYQSRHCWLCGGFVFPHRSCGRIWLERVPFQLSSVLFDVGYTRHDLRYILSDSRLNVLIVSSRPEAGLRFQQVVSVSMVRMPLFRQLDLNTELLFLMMFMSSRMACEDKEPASVRTPQDELFSTKSTAVAVPGK